MFEFNGYVYASEPARGLRVESARVVDDLCMLVTFSTGETRLLDATKLLGFEAFAPLADRKVFEDFSVDHGVLSWRDGDIDIAPEGLYKRTYEYAPLPVAL
jgi:hypothetical protein